MLYYIEYFVVGQVALCQVEHKHDQTLSKDMIIEQARNLICMMKQLLFLLSLFQGKGTTLSVQFSKAEIHGMGNTFLKYFYFFIVVLTVYFCLVAFSMQLTRPRWKHLVCYTFFPSQFIHNEEVSIKVHIKKVKRCCRKALKSAPTSGFLFFFLQSHTN